MRARITTQRHTLSSLVGTDMLSEQIPANLEFFGFPATTAAHLRSPARLP